MPWFMVLLFFAAGHSSQGKGSAREILDLPRSTAEVGYPVEFTAVVTLVFPGERCLFVHDSSAGIYVGTESVPNVEAGDLVMIQGRTRQGGCAAPSSETQISAESGVLRCRIRSCLVRVACVRI